MTTYTMKNFFCRSIIFLLNIFFFIIIFNFSLFADTQSSQIICDEDNLIIDADQLSIERILELLSQKCDITISGLKIPKDHTITYHSSGNIIDEIKRLLKYLNAENNAFEFSGNKLTHVIVFSKGKSKYYLPPASFERPDLPPREKISAVKVVEIVPGSQAEVHGFQKGDIIIEYDSVKITSASQLVDEVKKKKHLQRVELVLTRDKTRLNYIINSGLIGVRIQTIRVFP